MSRPRTVYARFLCFLLLLPAGSALPAPADEGSGCQRRWTFPVPFFQSVAWSPDGATLAFSAVLGDWDEGYGIYLVDLAGGEPPVRLDTGGERALYPVFSPDGSRLAYGSQGDVWVAGVDGGGPERLTDHPAKDGFPSWSPDGSRLAFHSERDGNYEIYVMGADGSSPIRVTNHPADDFNPAWSPDGSSIAFDSDRIEPQGDEIYRIAPDGSDLRRVVEEGVFPTWSADGKSLLYAAGGLRSVGADGGEAISLAEHAVYGSWSPDGSLIAAAIFEFDEDCSDRHSLVLLEPDGALRGSLVPRAGATGDPDATASDSQTPDLVGAWHGVMTHDGQEEPFHLELEPHEGDKLLMRWTVPAMNLSRVPVAVLDRVPGEGEVALGPLSLDYDPRADTLTGVMPAGMVPRYEVPIVLGRVESIEPLERPEPAAREVAPLWVFEAGSALWPGATFAGGLVFAGDDRGVLHALDAATGVERWSFTAGGPIRTRPTAVDGSIVFQADDGVLYRLDAAAGREIWRVRLLDRPVERLPPGDPQSRYDHFGSDVAVAGDRLYVGTHDGRVLALDAADGTVLWRHRMEDGVLAAPAVAAGRVYAAALDGQVHCLDAATGSRLWATDAGGAVLSTPAVAGERLIVGTRSYDILALETATGEVAWKRYVWFSWIESPASVRGDAVYIGTSDAAAVYALSAATGETLWKTDVRGWSWGQPAVTAQRAYVQVSGMRGYQADNHRGSVAALDRATGEIVWRYAAEPPEQGIWGFPGSPAVGDGRVYVTGVDGRVMAFAQ